MDSYFAFVRAALIGFLPSSDVVDGIANGSGFVYITPTPVTVK